ncbi:hypothetical protein FJO69_01790 [[Mycoplasma] falconis]|uniref:Rho termination factor N-terminal domain-containing protein n=1 Tax=[Mycoplasma] falconis TaxID=92403 RepID=A0A501XA03_9BACT|nr:hypothetical protein [[Mycoplasma] falconis]TPE57342.1 hypothetical protein FJO69_01790 [[Mycoplasma] falconis]
MNIDLNEYSSPQQLYDKNYKKWNPWFIAFTVLFALIVLLQVATLIYYAAAKQTYIAYYTSAISESNKSLANPQASANNQYLTSLLLQTFATILGAAVFVWHVVSFVRAMNKKDYSLYSFWLVQIYIFIIIWNILSIIFGGISYFSIPAWDINQILKLVYTLLVIVVYFAVWWRCGKVIKLFRILKFNITQKQMMANSGFNELFNNFMQQANGMRPSEEFPQTSQNQEASAAEMYKDDYRSKLARLDDKQLLAMAEKLNIFGANSFSREELIEKIAAIFEEKNIVTKPEEKSKKQDNEEDDKEVN